MSDTPMPSTTHLHLVKTNVLSEDHVNQDGLVRLRSSPEALNDEEWSLHLDTYRHLLDIDEVLDLTTRRLRKREYKDNLEKNALLAITEGRMEDVERLFELIDRRNAAGFKVV